MYNNFLFLFFFLQTAQKIDGKSLLLWKLTIAIEESNKRTVRSLRADDSCWPTETNHPGQRKRQYPWSVDLRDHRS